MLVLGRASAKRTSMDSSDLTPAPSAPACRDLGVLGAMAGSERKAASSFPRESGASVFHCQMAMKHNLWLHIGVDEHPFANYFDVHQGYRDLTQSQIMAKWGLLPAYLPTSVFADIKSPQAKPAGLGMPPQIQKKKTGFPFGTCHPVLGVCQQAIQKALKTKE